MAKKNRYHSLNKIKFKWSYIDFFKSVLCSIVTSETLKSRISFMYIGKYTTNPPITAKNNKLVIMTDQTGMESSMFFQGISTFFFTFWEKKYWFKKSNYMFLFGNLMSTFDWFLFWNERMYKLSSLEIRGWLTGWS